MKIDHIPDVVARPVGQAPASINKRPADARAYLVDCAQLMVRARPATPPADGLVCRARPLAGGTVLEVHLAGGPAPVGVRPLDVPLRLAVVTTQGQIELALTVRMHE
jgi:hypothetical protein